MHGVLVVDKPKGVTSFDVVARVRRAFGVRRVGHAGTLDPMATGVLPICVGDACKLVPFLQDGEKEYRAEARLGVTTDSEDAEGQVLVEKDASGVTRAAVEAQLARMIGVIQQIPPMHSALRAQGKRLYELARAGLTVERAARPVEIHALAVEEFVAPRLIFTVRCGKGTYVRTLAADLGAALGVGAHLTGLRRTRVGRFTVADAVPLDAVSGETPLIGLADALSDAPALALDETQAQKVRDGQLKAIAALTPPPGEEPFVRLLRPDGSLLAVAERAGPHLTLARVFN
jgi:tRNA pseudouridine55 synthase